LTGNEPDTDRATEQSVACGR